MIFLQKVFFFQASLVPFML